MRKRVFLYIWTIYILLVIAVGGIFYCIFNGYSYEKYGVIYNNGGSVTCMETSFLSGGVSVYNYATGMCAVGGLHNAGYSVVYDHPWSNAKAGLIRGLFLLGTAFISYGAGSMIGYALPGMMGLVVSSVAGALIGATAGAIYGAWEGSVYHDYSGLWKNILSFSVWV